MGAAPIRYCSRKVFISCFEQTRYASQNCLSWQQRRSLHGIQKIRTPTRCRGNTRNGLKMKNNYNALFLKKSSKSAAETTAPLAQLWRKFRPKLTISPNNVAATILPLAKITSANQLSSSKRHTSSPDAPCHFIKTYVEVLDYLRLLHIQYLEKFWLPIRD